MWLLPASGSPNPRFPPYVVRPLHMLGAPAYGSDLSVLLGIELGRAPNATPTVVSGTGVLKVREIIAYSEHLVKSRKVVPQQGAPYVTHSVVWRTTAP